MGNDHGYSCCSDDPHWGPCNRTYEMRDVIPRDLTEKIKAARLLRDAGHISAETYMDCIASIVDEHIPG